MATVNFIHISDAEGGEATKALNRAVADMVRVSTINGRWRVQMPVASRFGSMVDVSVWPEGDGDTFLVSDDGAAYHAAATAAASNRIFTSVARSFCEKYGAIFDGGTMLFMRVSADRLKGAIVAMAALTKEVIDETLERSFAEKAHRIKDRFLERIDRAFPHAEVSQNVGIRGHSTAEHEFDALVEINGGALAFDLFSKAAVSVNSAYVKLADLSRLEVGPKPIGATRKRKDIGPKLNLINSVATVIEVDTDLENYARLAA
ncbi:hypothetical protein [Shimia sagamensis]|uniref:DUF1828 domain-containing protein n=1 Tax=Shimia sagamensis TaxID=1566352 RepID=A0ABY1PN12_9RHOB|nr:hypothetical protein [Shimia sagamensis]SMP35346.1 hypothetical protein SAMN06265373_11177 [Shimia sagamensis]